MMNHLVVLALTFSVGASTIGCSGASTPTAPLSSTISTTAPSRALVDAAAVWAEHPLPPCKDYLGTDLTVPPGISVPDYDSVAKELAGVKSPGDESWVRTKLGWLDMWLAQTRAAILDHPEDSNVVHATNTRFGKYVEHLRAELQSGRDISDSSLDSRFPQECI
ncbi:hypothetical protein [Mycobacteroides abscessus]|uniref:hypothetical protein n=1 Tax=Mycobacteroides abscessus TaxID=36809 RepID=UPI000929B661|nr:hypothetical protein [Mycobacteroides abscessus]SHX81792.1 Uncharacterised protein [Mycobacteroides abscessus subsp. abscessus]SKM69668.1 Uncharacterised protein [Mycobacteroides abscessus subsp. abscessus]SKN72787.1 Uncharacterised protein [Mycobacteroides abscessus subsp. abscessus]SKR46357.1 Uncharacterised protein [Mycobacteroides abscessus subsp. abscessus]SKR62942.1 Uncharacterised protein [Mycobacteroides abscessus subsp. abscessus]